MYYYSRAYDSVVWLMVSLVLAIVGGVCLYVCFVRKDKELTDPKLVKLRDFLQFRTLIIEPVLKALYCILAIFITLYSFSMISSSFLGFLMFLIFGNVVVRLGYEGSMIILMIWRNTSEINKKMKVEDKCECKCEAPKEDAPTNELEKDTPEVKAAAPKKTTRKKTTE